MTRTRRISQDQAYRLARRAGATDREARFLAAVMIPESGGNPNAVNPTSGATGLWQIHPGGSQYLDPLKNAQTAIYKLRTQGKEAWEAYTRGLVGSYTPAATQAASGAPVAAQGDQRSSFVRALLNPRTAHDPMKLLGAIRSLQAAQNEPDTNGSAPSSGAPGGLLAQLRDLGVADAVTSGERSPAANRATGGSPTSYHLPGGPDAYDLDPSDPQIPALVRYARRHPGYFKEFFGPMDWYIKNGKIYQGQFPGHSDHYHAAR